MRVDHSCEGRPKLQRFGYVLKRGLIYFENPHEILTYWLTDRRQRVVVDGGGDQIGNQFSLGYHKNLY